MHPLHLSLQRKLRNGYDIEIMITHVVLDLSSVRRPPPIPLHSLQLSVPWCSITWQADSAKFVALSKTWLFLWFFCAYANHTNLAAGCSHLHRHLHSLDVLSCAGLYHQGEVIQRCQVCFSPDNQRSCTFTRHLSVSNPLGSTLISMHLASSLTSSVLCCS